MTVLTGTGSEADTRAAMIAYNLVVDGETGTPEEVAAPVEEVQSEKPEVPGETSVAEPVVETAPVSETGETKPQETQEPAGEKQHPPRSNFKSKIEKLENRLAKASDDLEMAHGDKTRLRQELEAAKAELAKHTAPPVETKVAELVEPVFPTKADADYDEEKHDQMLRQYGKDMIEYSRKVAQKEVADARVEEQKQRAQEERQANADKAYKEYVGRLQEDMKGIPDYDDIVAEFNESVGDQKIDVPENIETHIQIASEHPGYLTHFFLKDHLTNGGKELARIAALTPFLQLREINRLEARLTTEYAGTPAAVAPPVVAAPPAAAAPKVPEIPAKPKLIPKVHDEPITPVGARASGPVETLEKAAAGGMASYMASRNKGINR